MKNQKIYPIGYLLKILHISYTDLAKALYLDRTVVNKWALGKRTFNSKSKHYSKVVEYIININEDKNENSLEKFFERIYPDIQKSEMYIKECIDKFLGEPDIISNIGGSIINATDNVIHCSVPVYKTTFGRFAALLDLLDKIILSDSKYELILYDNEQYKWLTEDEYYKIQFKKTMINVLERGHEVTFISEVDYLSQYYQFGKIMEMFYYYSNFNEYYFISNNNAEIIYSYYMVKGEHVIMGNRLINDDLYTISLSDPYSIAACEARVRHHLKFCVIHNTIRNDNDRFQLISLIKKIERTNDISFVYTVGLSFITMSKKLLYDVLKSNKVYGEKRNQILSFIENHEKYVYDKPVSKPAFRKLCYFEDIEQMLVKDNWYLQDLSLLIGKKIFLNQRQIIQHIRDTADLLERKKNFSLGFLRDWDPFYRTKYTILCRKNQYCITCQGHLRMTREVSIINPIIDLFETEWQRNIPYDYKDNNIVSQRLRELIKNCEKNKYN